MLEVRANGLRFACVDEGRGPLVLLLREHPEHFTRELVRVLNAERDAG